jgi:uncharacterized protein (TIGR00290 family)
MAPPRAAISWSGGKDSCAALRRARTQYDVVSMVTMFDEDQARSRSHGLRPEVLAEQAERLGLTQFIGRCTWDNYSDVFKGVLHDVASTGVTHVVFGDIMFDEHRRWAERMCEQAGLTAVEPLWGESTDVLFDEWIASGASALIVTARAQYLDASWLGRRLIGDMAPEFDRLGVDRCGERGEYHTVVIDTPLFSRPLALQRGAVLQHGGCWALDVRLEADTTAVVR